jgi:hypothetical protein
MENTQYNTTFCFNTFELRIVFLVSPLMNERAQVLFDGNGVILKVLLAVLAMVPLAHYENCELRGLFLFLSAFIIQFKTQLPCFDCFLLQLFLA